MIDYVLWLYEGKDTVVVNEIDIEYEEEIAAVIE